MEEELAVFNLCGKLNENDTDFIGKKVRKATTPNLCKAVRYLHFGDVFMIQIPGVRISWDLNLL